MKAVWITDIHLDFVEEEGISRFLESIDRENPDVVLLTGDIGEADSVCGYLERIDSLQHPICFVVGNHNYYGSSVEEVRKDVSAVVRSSGHLCWMNEGGVVSLSSRTALVGHDGWADGSGTTKTHRSSSTTSI